MRLVTDMADKLHFPLNDTVGNNHSKPLLKPCVSLAHIAHIIQKTLIFYKILEQNQDFDRAGGGNICQIYKRQACEKGFLCPRQTYSGNATILFAGRVKTV